MLLLRIYKVSTFLLLPIGLYLGLGGLFALPIALSNPVALLPLSIVICTAIYIFSCLVFVYRSLIKHKKCKKIIMDLIKINAFISIVFSFMCTLVFASLLMHHDMVDQLMIQYNELRKTMQPTAPPITPAMVVNMSYFVIFCTTLILVHISFSLSFVKNLKIFFLED